MAGHLRGGHPGLRIVEDELEAPVAKVVVGDGGRVADAGDEALAMGVEVAT